MASDVPMRDSRTTRAVIFLVGCAIGALAGALTLLVAT